jgi:excisionase family DNA binding protein
MVKFVIESEDLFDVEEAAGLLGIGYATVYRWISSKKIIPVRMDNRTLIPRSEVERLKREKAAEKTAA